VGVKIVLTAAVAALVGGAALASVPLRPAADGHLTIPAYINGLGPYPFILDTGADGTDVYQWFGAQQKLPTGHGQHLTGMTGTTAVPTYRVAKLTVDGRSIANLTASGLPDRHDAGKQAGVAGNDLMDGAVVVFDFPCRTVALHSKPVDLATLVPKGAQAVEGGKVREGTQLTLPVWINGARGMAVLDTGSRDTKVNPRFAAAAGVDPNSRAFHDTDLIYGANSKPMVSRKGPVGEIRFGGRAVKNAEVRVMDLPVFQTFGLGDGPAMILGQDVIGRYRLVYDHQARRFWFTPSACPG
jgi:predicted aspartyl protease